MNVKIVYGPHFERNKERAIAILVEFILKNHFAPSESLQVQESDEETQKSP